MEREVKEGFDRGALASAMVEFGKQKPGFDPTNYPGAQAAFQADYRVYKKDADFNRQYHVSELQRILEQCPDDVLQQAFSNRLSVVTDGEKYRLEYCAGQYWCTEYQGALRSVIEGLSNYVDNKEVETSLYEIDVKGLKLQDVPGWKTAGGGVERKREKTYLGPVVGVSSRHFAQDIGRGEIVVHDRQDVRGGHNVQVGDNLRIEYPRGRGTAERFRVSQVSRVVER